VTSIVNVSRHTGLRQCFHFDIDRLPLNQELSVIYFIVICPLTIETTLLIFTCLLR